MNFKTSDYKNRKDLEKVIRAEVGEDHEKNREAGHTVEGSLSDLRRLQLDDTKNVFGVQAVSTTESVKEEKQKGKVERPVRRRPKHTKK